VKFKALIAVFLIAGLLISLYGRAEAEALFYSDSSSDPFDSTEANGPPAEKNHPIGAHKDQHGCYHSDAQLNLPVVVCPFFPPHYSRYIAKTRLPLFLTITSSIVPPPRA
jgi:hypothetical protein